MSPHSKTFQFWKNSERMKSDLHHLGRMKTSSILIVALLVIAASAARAQNSQPEARKFDEFTAGIGSPEYRYGNYDQQQQELKAPLLDYTGGSRTPSLRTDHLSSEPAKTASAWYQALKLWWQWFDNERQKKLARFCQSRINCEPDLVSCFPRA
jgi:hypothetical protein